MDLIEKAAAKLRDQQKSKSLVEKAAEQATQPTTAEVAPVAETPTVGLKNTTLEQKASKKSRAVEINLDRLKSMNILTGEEEATITAEEFRLVKRSLLLNAFAKGDKAVDRGNLVLVSSSQPNEGKTFCAINLAMSMATERDLTVLLVDADVNKPDIPNLLGIEKGKGLKGLVDVIADDGVDLADCLLKTNIENLTILPAGRKHHQTTELLASGRMGNIVDEIAQRYPDRIIIIDSPPVLASSAASVLALHVGQILFVVEAERTEEHQLKEALSLVSSCKNISLLLNKSVANFADKTFGKYYGYGHDHDR